MKLSEYLKNNDIECIIDLSKDNWDRMFSLKGLEIINKIDEGFNRIKISSCTHSGKIVNYQMVTVFEMTFERNLTKEERNIHGMLAHSIGTSLALPYELWFTIYRCNIQNKREALKGKKRSATIDGIEYEITPK